MLIFDLRLVSFVRIIPLYATFQSAKRFALVAAERAPHYQRSVYIWFQMLAFSPLMRNVTRGIQP